MFRFLFILMVLGLSGTLGAAESSTGQQLLDLGWGAIKGFGSIISKALLHMFLWGIFGFVLGVVGGVFMWRALRDRGWMDVPWNWYRYVRWMWPVLIVCTLSFGLSSALSTWGAGRAFKKEVREGEVIEKAVFNTYAMVMVWRLGPQKDGDNNGSALLEQDLALAVSKLKEASDKVTGVEDKAREKALEQMEDKIGGGYVKKRIYSEILNFVWDQQVKSELTDNEAADFLSDTLKTEKSGGAEAAVKAVRQKIMSGVYLAVDETVNAAVYPIVWSIIPSMILVLMGPLSSFWLVRWLWLRKYPETTGETDSVQIQDDEPPVIESDKS